MALSNRHSWLFVCYYFWLYQTVIPDRLIGWFQLIYAFNIIFAIIFLNNSRRDYSLTNNHTSTLDLCQDHLRFLQDDLDFVDLYSLQLPPASTML